MGEKQRLVQCIGAPPRLAPRAPEIREDAQCFRAADAITATVGNRQGIHAQRLGLVGASHTKPHLALVEQRGAFQCRVATTAGGREYEIEDLFGGAVLAVLRVQPRDVVERS